MTGVENYQTKAIIVAFMDWFSRISVLRYSDALTPSNEEVYLAREFIPVPIQWASYDKWMSIYNSSTARKAMDTEIREKNPVELQWVLPRISVYLNSVMYDSQRKLIKTQTVPNFPGDTVLQKTRQYTPSPYNLDMEVTVIAKTLDDSFQIMEQIIPYFSPELSLDVFLIPGMESESVPIVLNGITPELPMDFDETTERLFTFSYNFTVKMNLYPKKLYSKSKTVIGSGASGSNILTINGSVSILGITPGTKIYGTGIPSGTIVVSVTDDTTLVLSNKLTTTLVNEPLTMTGGDLISSIEVPNCNFGAVSNIVSIPAAMIGQLIPGMFVWGNGIGAKTYINSIDTTNNTITLSAYTLEAGVFETLYFGVNKTIEHVKTNLYMGKDYVQISHDWIEATKSVSEKFIEYESNASTPNPFI